MKEDQFQLGDVISEYPLVLYYQGNYKENPSFSIVDMVEKNLSLYFKKAFVNKLSFLVVEAVQNIERYSDDNSSTEDFCIIFSDYVHFNVVTQNRIETKNIAALKERLDTVNSKHREELNELYINTLNLAERTSKGAGLGLIDMARKSKNSLAYEFTTKTEELSTYRLHIKIPIVELETMPDTKTANEAFISLLSNNFQSNKSSFFYTGDFSNNFLKSLLSMLTTVKKSDKDSVKSIFQYNIIELTQNMKRHGVVIDGKVPGYLCIEWLDNKAIISVLNIISDENTALISSKIDMLNAASLEELKKLNQECLSDFTLKGGLGLIDLALLNRPNKISYSFPKISKFGQGIYINVEVNYE